MLLFFSIGHNCWQVAAKLVKERVSFTRKQICAGKNPVWILLYSCICNIVRNELLLKLLYSYFVFRDVVHWILF